MHKKLALTLAVGYTLFLTILSLISLRKIPKLGSSFDDKIYHFGAYVLLTVLWYNFAMKTSTKWKILYSAGFSIVFGIIVEVLQGTVTTYRTLDVLDLVANSTGVLFAVILISVFKKDVVKIN